MSLMTLFDKFRKALEPDSGVETIKTVNVTGEPESVMQIVAPGLAIGDTDRLVAIGWRNTGTAIRLHIGLVAAFAVSAMSLLKPKFFEGYRYLGSVSRTMVNGKIATVAATTAEAFADPIGFASTLAWAIQLAGFDGLFRRGTKSNVINFATPASTSTLVLTVDGRDYVLPQLPGTWRDGDVITHCVDPERGTVLVAKVGGTRVYEVDISMLVKGEESIALAVQTPALIVEVGKYIGGSSLVTQVTTMISIIDLAYDAEKKEYVLAKETEVPETDVACMGTSTGGSFNFTGRNEAGGKSKIFLVPASEVPDEIAAPWKTATIGDPDGLSSSTAPGAERIGQDSPTAN